MPLDDDEIESIREMVGDKTFATIESLCGELNTAQEAAMRADVVLWEANKNELELEVSGGRDGMDLKTERVLKAIRRRVRERLQLSVSGGLTRIPVGHYSYDV